MWLFLALAATSARCRLSVRLARRGAGAPAAHYNVVTSWSTVLVPHIDNSERGGALGGLRRCRNNIDGAEWTAATRGVVIAVALVELWTLFWFMLAHKRLNPNLISCIMEYGSD